ncbi:carbon catabolite repressor protein 4 homolog 4-like [Phragmites australis]|uniref:carbon catabolite repressor protein 4 homolog 4-like n=1 Tax=Phragmites australis TaxID=29695 RepID=UPI002D77768C|nr:carbon catabolite repressor protein 4 homolog 4-like [Phragmites australis]
MLKPQTAWAASLPLFLLRRRPRSTPKPSPAVGRRLPFLPVCKRRMSTQAQPRFAPLPTEQPESDAGAAGYQFRLVSYNILAQVYVKSAFFPHSPPACLKWKSRSKAVLTELKSFDADLMCIQELDEYDTFYKKNMENSGYSSIYIQRSGDKRDGCGIFYRPKSAELVQKEGIHYNDLVEIYAPSDHVNNAPSNNFSPEEEMNPKSDNNKRGDPNDPRVRMKRDCVGLLAAFKLSDPCDHILIVANTHIYWDPQWIDVKLAQAKYLLSRVSQFEKLVSNKFNCKSSVIIAGDFNSTPGDKVYNYLVSANLESTDEAPIKLRSLYAANGGEPEFTNCTPGFTGTLDYIFSSDGSSIKPTSLLCLPGGDSANVQGGLPNFQHPSDHLPIGADFLVVNS